MNLGSGFVELLSLTSLEADGVAGVLKKYDDLRPQLADACLVYLANRDGIDTIFTLDRRDFLVYRSGASEGFSECSLSQPPPRRALQIPQLLFGMTRLGNLGQNNR